MAQLVLLPLLLLLSVRESASVSLPDSKELRALLSRYQEEAQQGNISSTSGNRARRAIRWSDREEIIQLHNKLRSGVYPTSSNMEYMVWDEELERSATHWGEQCQWDHGPEDLLRSIGQNLGVHWGRYRAPAFHVQAWYDEVKDYTYPYPHECNPWCPDHCSGPMCTHYTQLVWATTSRVGCAVHVCPQMNVWGEIWENAVYLVCNYSPKGNWIGEAPYKHGRPCSQCPPSYGGGCRNNLCYKDSQISETEDMNEVEKPQVPLPPRTTPKPTVKPKPPKKPVSRPSPPRTSTPSTPSSRTPNSSFLAHNIKCETRLRDKCRGATCNRFKCPANCLNRKGRVYGTLFYDVQSSICRAAIHFGVMDNNGGVIDVTRMDKFPFFVKSQKNGVESFSKYKPGNAFVMTKVQEISVDCYATVAEICPYKKPNSHCPRISCPTDCKIQPSYWSPVIGNNIYADTVDKTLWLVVLKTDFWLGLWNNCLCKWHSSICKAAIHAGVIRADGGLVDVLPLDKRKNYVGVLKNGIVSESTSNTEGGSFRVFTVRQ